MGQPAHQHAPHPDLLAELLPANEYDRGTPAAALGLQPVHDQGLQGDPECCGAGLAPRVDRRLHGEGNGGLPDGRHPWPDGKVWPKDLPAALSGHPEVPAGAPAAPCSRGRQQRPGSSATISGWACDPEWPGAIGGVEIYGGAPRESGRDAARRSSRRSGAGDAARRRGQRGVRWSRPQLRPPRVLVHVAVNQAGNVFVYAIDQATADGPAAPPTLIRNGIVSVPRCAHSEHVAGEALATGCSACAANLCGDGRTASAAASTGRMSAPPPLILRAGDQLGRRQQPLVRGGDDRLDRDTATGTYTFEASAVPSRVFVNGRKLSTGSRRRRGRRADDQPARRATLPPALGSPSGRRAARAARPRASPGSPPASSARPRSRRRTST